MYTPTENVASEWTNVRAGTRFHCDSTAQVALRVVNLSIYLALGTFFFIVYVHKQRTDGLAFGNRGICQAEASFTAISRLMDYDIIKYAADY